MIRRDRISFRVFRFFTNGLSLRDPAVPFKGGRHRARSNWVDVYRAVAIGRV